MLHHHRKSATLIAGLWDSEIFPNVNTSCICHFARTSTSIALVWPPYSYFNVLLMQLPAYQVVIITGSSFISISIASPIYFLLYLIAFAACWSIWWPLINYYAIDFLFSSKMPSISSLLKHRSESQNENRMSLSLSVTPEKLQRKSKRNFFRNLFKISSFSSKDKPGKEQSVVTYFSVDLPVILL